MYVPAYAFLPDGIINEESFAKSSPRVLFIAKEAYWYGEHDDDKAAAKNAETVMFWHRRVAYGEVPETIFSTMTHCANKDGISTTRYGMRSVW